MSKNAYRAIAQRIVNAEDNFAETVMRATGCDAETAAKVTEYYLKHKLAKLDAVIGRINVKHGAFLEPEVLANAVAAVS